MDRPFFLRRIVDWVRAGYPTGVPTTDYQPLLALLERQLTADEVKFVARNLINQAGVDEPIGRVETSIEINKVIDELPSENDIQRVRERLEHKGWPFDNSPFDDAASSPDHPE